jgi:hypothetical protein
MPATLFLQPVGRGALVLLGVLLLTLGGSCGRKLPPIQPGVLPPPAVADLSYEMHGSEIVLIWSLPAFRQDQESAAAGFKVLRARQTAAEAECQTCPAPFQTIGDVWASGKRPASRLRFRDALEPGFKYRYKLKSYSADGVFGKDSNEVTLLR